MSRQILVAGGAGFIASHICDLLLAEGSSVTVIDSFVTGRRANLEAALKKGARLIDCDIRDDAKLRSVVSGMKFDEIFSLASPASPVDFSKMPIFILETAAIGHRNLLDLAREHRARILFASSSEVYGDAEIHPQVETYFGNVSTTGHRSCYDEAKRFGEALNAAYMREFQLETRTARIFNTYGPRMRPDDGRIIPNFFMQALQGQALTVYGDGSQTRSFCFVSDQAAGQIALMRSSESRPVNIGNPIEKTVLEIASAVNALTGNKTPIRHLPLPEHDPKQRKPDITRAQAFGWQPRVSLETGLQACAEYFRSELASAPGGIKARTLENL